MFIREGVQELNEGMVSIQEIEAKQLQNSSNALDQLAEQRSQLTLLQSQSQEIKQIQIALTAKTDLLHMLFEQFKRNEWSRKPRTSSDIELEKSLNPQPGKDHGNNPSSRDDPAPFSVSTDKLLDATKSDPLDPQRDCKYVLKQASLHEYEHQGQAKWVMQQKVFQRWMLSKHSSFLFVNDEDGSIGMDRITSVTILCASLCLCLQSMQKALVAQYYCSLHLTSRDHSSGPTRLLRSLIAQMLLQNTSYTISIQSPEALDLIEASDFNALCVLFKQLLEQKPKEEVLFVIIDGIAHYDRHTWIGELRSFITMLQAMVSSSQSILKVLITGVKCKRSFQEAIPSHDTLRVPECRDEQGVVGQQELAYEFHKSELFINE